MVLTLDWMFRFLLSNDWEKNFPNVYQRPLMSLLSDHSQIILEGIFREVVGCLDLGTCG